MLVKVFTNTRLCYSLAKLKTHALWLRNPSPRCMLNRNSILFVPKIVYKDYLSIYILCNDASICASLTALDIQGMVLGPVVHSAVDLLKNIFLQTPTVFCTLTAANSKQPKCPPSIECMNKLCHLIQWNNLQQWKPMKMNDLHLQTHHGGMSQTQC